MGEDVRTLDALHALAEALEREQARQRVHIEQALPQHGPSAENLAHYLALRRRDVRPLQLELAALGLSSLGRCEGHVRDTVRRLCGWLSAAPQAPETASLDRARAEALLHRNTAALLGKRPADRHVYIMVTAPEVGEATASWADALLDAGVDVLRINGAHESERESAATLQMFKARAALRGRPARVFIDLPGPKLRIEIRQTEDAVLHFPRRKDRQGRTLAATQLRLVAQHAQGNNLPIPADWLPALRAGDRLDFTDAGGRDRTLVVREVRGEEALAACERSLYLRGGLALTWRRGDDVRGKGKIGHLPRVPRVLEFHPGDAFVINADGACADAATPALAFGSPELLMQVCAGERVVLDDGRIVAVVESSGPEGLACRVQRCVKLPTRLRSGKGIAFPDSLISLGALAGGDEAALEFALGNADGVGVSFVNSGRDVRHVGERIRASGKGGFGMILKLETHGAIDNLAEILFEALKYDPVGLMIARGDLAVELSFERLAEMQEELLWFGEACHLPVVWATQVLDSVAQTGIPTRAEVTDAAMAMRAECVMLNRGPHVAVAVRMLAGIIRKMEAHQFKKLSLYRPLAVAGE
jgi:pyruvate kinase